MKINVHAFVLSTGNNEQMKRTKEIRNKKSNLPLVKLWRRSLSLDDNVYAHELNFILIGHKGRSYNKSPS